MHWECQAGRRCLSCKFQISVTVKVKIVRGSSQMQNESIQSILLVFSVISFWHAWHVVMHERQHRESCCKRSMTTSMTPDLCSDVLMCRRWRDSLHAVILQLCIIWGCAHTGLARLILGNAIDLYNGADFPHIFSVANVAVSARQHRSARAIFVIFLLSLRALAKQRFLSRNTRRLCPVSTSCRSAITFW